MSDYSLRIKVQNGRIRAAMKAANVENAASRTVVRPALGLVSTRPQTETL